MARGARFDARTKKSCHSSRSLEAPAIFGPPEQTLHSLGFDVCAPLNSIAAALLLHDNLYETLIVIAATLTFEDSLERNVHIYIGNVDF